MTDQTLPASGGSYIRNEDGSLTQVEAPTAGGYRLASRAAVAEAAPEVPDATPVEAPVEEGSAPAFKSRRPPVAAPVKEA